MGKIISFIFIGLSILFLAVVFLYDGKIIIFLVLVGVVAIGLYAIIVFSRGKQVILDKSEIEKELMRIQLRRGMK